MTAPTTEKVPLLVTLQPEPRDSCPAIFRVPVEAFETEADAALMVMLPLAVIVPELLSTQEEPMLKEVRLMLLPDPMVN